MFDPTAKLGSIASRTRYGLKRSGVRGRPPLARVCFRVSTWLAMLGQWLAGF